MLWSSGLRCPQGRARPHTGRFDALPSLHALTPRWVGRACGLRQQKGDVGSFEERTAADLEKRRAREAKYIEAFVKPPPKKHFSRSQRRIRKAASSLMKGLRSKKHGHAGTAAL